MLQVDRDEPSAGANPSLVVESNVHIKCGDDGVRENLCWFFEGDLHIDATEFRGIRDETVDNVVIEGMVFIGAQRHSLWATKPGSITFIDCEFRVSENYQKKQVEEDEGFYF